MKDRDFDAKVGESNSIDGHASGHLLFLLHKDMKLPSVIHFIDTERAITGKFLDNPEEVNAYGSNSFKTLTLETLLDQLL